MKIRSYLLAGISFLSFNTYADYKQTGHCPVEFFNSTTPYGNGYCKKPTETYSSGYISKVIISSPYKITSSRGKIFGPGTYDFSGESYRDHSWTVGFNDNGDSNEEVCLYRENNQLGSRRCLSQSVEDLESLSFINSTYSISFPPGKGYQAKLYSGKNFTGNETIVSVSKNISLNGGVSSIKIYTGLNAYSDVEDYYLVPFLDKYRKSRFATNDDLSLSLIDEGISMWRLNFIDNGNTVSFLSDNGQELCLRSNHDITDQEKACQWSVELVEPNSFRLRNVDSGDYLKLSSDRKLVVMGSNNGDPAVWSLKTKEETLPYKEIVNSYIEDYITTDPSKPYIPENKKTSLYDQGGKDYQTNQFDWTSKILNYYSYNGSSNPTLEDDQISPFYLHNLGRYPFSVDESNTFMIPDNLPESGWELVQQNMGYYSDGVTVVEQKSYGLPYFILYNKYTSKIRVIALYDIYPGVYNGAAIKLSHNGTNNRVATNLFSPTSPSHLSEEAKATGVTALAKLYPVDDVQWIYADFDVGYDPCTSCFDSILSVTITPIANGDIALTGVTAGNAVPIRDSDGRFSQDYFTSYLDSGTGVDSQVGNITFASYEALYDEFKDQEDYATAVYKENTWLSTSDSATALDKLSQGFGAVSSLSPEPISSAFLGGVSSIFSFANFSVPAQIEGFDLPPPMPTVNVGEVALRGNVSFEGQADIMNIAMPGAQNTKYAREVNQRGGEMYPSYNEELGVFSLIGNIEMGIYEYSDSTLANNRYLCTDSCHITKVFDDLFYTINPASGWTEDDLDVTVALERFVNGERDSITEFVPIKNWKDLAIADKELYVNDVSYNLKVVVSSAGLVESPERLLDPTVNNARFFQSYTYPVKFRHHQSGPNYKRPGSGVIYNHNKPRFIPANELKDTFCREERYSIKDTSIN